MSPKLPIIPACVAIKAVEIRGFKLKNQRGSHKVFKHPDGRRTTIIDHGNTPLDRSVLKRIMRDTGVTVEELKE